ncbi:MAG: Clp protease N-terminal domain-containing protein [Acidimicrobiales bacterium]
MFDRFTPSARLVVLLARDEAVRQNHRHVGTEHLLITLLAEPDSIAGVVFAHAGLIEAPRLRAEVLSALGHVA